MPMLLSAYTVMLCVTVSNKDGGWGGIVITLFDSVGTILLFCSGGTYFKQYQLCLYIQPFVTYVRELICCF